jgi:hypothetical protein
VVFIDAGFLAARFYPNLLALTLSKPSKPPCFLGVFLSGVDLDRQAGFPRPDDDGISG